MTLNMRSGMAAAKAHALRNQIIREKERILDRFAVCPTTSCKAVTKVARTILLNSPYLLQGRFFEAKAKSLGAGVYELKMELKK